jgi:transcriptional regulator with XRE-family HTH domain
MERGEVAPSFETVERVVRELDVPPSFLFGGQDALRTDRTALIEEALNALGRLKETDLRLAIRLIAALPEKRRE